MTRCGSAFLFIMFLVSSLGAAGGAGEPLPGTEPLRAEGDLASQMVEGIDRFLLRETQAAPQRRAALWKRDTSSAVRYAASVAGNRERLAKILGVVDAREKVEALELVATTAQPALVGRGRGYEVFAVRWPAIPGVWGEGL